MAAGYLYTSFFMGILVLFFIYTEKNRARIQEQNRVYAEDAATQTVERIESEFDNALQRIQNDAFLSSTDGKDLGISAQMLKELEENTTFDAVSFINADGINLGADGKTNDSSDRNFFLRGMQGESGLETVAESRLTGKPMMVFYAPIYENEDIAGMFFGDVLCGGLPERYAFRQLFWRACRCFSLHTGRYGNCPFGRWNFRG